MDAPSRRIDPPLCLIPGRRIFLTYSCDFVNDEYFARVFRETWDKLPSEVTDRIGEAAEADNTGLTVCVFTKLNFGRHGEASQFSLCISFSRLIVNFYPERELACVIAHELAHVYDNIGRGFARLNEDESVTEKRVTELHSLWGFPDGDGVIEYTGEDSKRIQGNIAIERTPERTELREKYRAAYHEAGHAVAYHVAGGTCVRAFVATNENRCDDEKTWLGQCEAIAKLRPTQKAIVGLSGIVADLLYQDPETTADEVFDLLSFDAIELSQSDLNSFAELLGRDAMSRDDWEACFLCDETAAKIFNVIENALDQLRSQWRLVERVAEFLVENELMTDTDFASLAMA